MQLDIILQLMKFVFLDYSDVNTTVLTYFPLFLGSYILLSGAWEK